MPVKNEVWGLACVTIPVINSEAKDLFELCVSILKKIDVRI